MNDFKVAGLGLEAADWRGPPPPPRANYSMATVQQPFTIENSNGESVGTHSSVSVAEFHEPCPLPMVGDIRIDVGGVKDGEEHFHFWFHAGMLAGRERLVRRKWMLDGLKDAKHKRFDASFCVVLELLRVAPPGIDQMKQQSLGGLL